MKSIFTLLFLSFILTISAQEKTYMLVGTYTNGKSKGIYVYEFNGKDGSSQLVDSIITSNPSFLAVSPDGKSVYAVNEDASTSAVAAFSFNKKNGKLKLINKSATNGDHPCYVAIDKTGKWVVAGNYTGGSVSLFEIQPNNGLSEVKDFVQHKGGSVNKDRQASAHVHATVFSPDNKFLYVPDLGTDKVGIYAFDEKKGKIRKSQWYFVKAPDGSGPRHMDFHPNGKWAYLVQELSGTITAYSYNKGQLKTEQTINALPSDYEGPISSADIHVSPDGKFLYASNRDTSNTIGIFKIDQTTGKLTHVGHQSTLGKTPRNFNFDPSGDFLLAANQNSDSIVVFRVNHANGLLTDTGQRIAVGKPVCIKWIRP